jgi:PhnB protein
MSTLTPHIVVSDAGRAAAWYEQALGAQVGDRIHVPDGRYMQIELRFGDARVMIADEFPEFGAVSPLTLGGTYGALTLAVDNADAAWQRALAAGATEFHPLEDAFWGERHGQIIDRSVIAGASRSASRTFLPMRCSDARPRSSRAKRAECLSVYR